MALLDVLLFVLTMFAARAFWRLLGGILEGIAGQPGPPGRRRSGVPERGVQMVRDPVCGTYVVPDRAVVLSDGTVRVYFCSAGCRDKYRARPSTRAGRPSSGSSAGASRDEPIEGRTA